LAREVAIRDRNQLKRRGKKPGHEQTFEKLLLMESYYTYQRRDYRTALMQAAMALLQGGRMPAGVSGFRIGFSNPAYSRDTRVTKRLIGEDIADLRNVMRTLKGLLAFLKDR
jgi:hypothetical protein